MDRISADCNQLLGAIGQDAARVNWPMNIHD